jgi:hypothetical protein
MAARRRAAAHLVKDLRRLTTNHPERRRIVISHSHGGNVALLALNALKGGGSYVDRVVCLGTPFVHRKPRPSFLVVTFFGGVLYAVWRFVVTPFVEMASFTREETFLRWVKPALQAVPLFASLTWWLSLLVIPLSIVLSMIPFAGMLGIITVASVLTRAPLPPDLYRHIDWSRVLVIQVTGDEARNWLQLVRRATYAPLAVFIGGAFVALVVHAWRVMMYYWGRLHGVDVVEGIQRIQNFRNELASLGMRGVATLALLLGAA